MPSSRRRTEHAEKMHVMSRTVLARGRLMRLHMEWGPSWGSPAIQQPQWCSTGLSAVGKGCHRQHLLYRAWQSLTMRSLHKKLKGRSASFIASSHITVIDSPNHHQCPWEEKDGWVELGSQWITVIPAPIWVLQSPDANLPDSGHSCEGAGRVPPLTIPKRIAAGTYPENASLAALRAPGNIAFCLIFLPELSNLRF